MRYVFIPIALTVILVVYLLYLLFIKKDKKQVKNYLSVGTFFIVIWAVMYYFLL